MSIREQVGFPSLQVAWGHVQGPSVRCMYIRYRDAYLLLD